MCAKRYVKTAETIRPQDRNGLPTQFKIAAYYRQSTLAQIGNVSTEIQKEDLPSRLIEMGWTKDLVISVDEEDGTSGTTSADQRPGMRRLYNLIESDEIAAVACVNADRLFRDHLLIHAPAFVQACLEHKIVIVVPGRWPYDLSHPQHANEHAEAFLRDCQEAGKYIKYHVKHRMNGAKDYRQSQGYYVGGAVCSGYIVNSKTARICTFEPIAQIVLSYFRLFVEKYKAHESSA